MWTKAHLKKVRKLRQLYNHANVLHDLAWEAEHKLQCVVERMVFKCKTKEEYHKLYSELNEVFRGGLWEPPTNPKPKRKTSHGGDVDFFNFYCFQHGQKLT